MNIEMLLEYKEIVGAAAGFVTFCQMFSGVFLCKDIYKSGSTNNIPITPFLGGFILSVLFYQHALLLNDTTMLTVNLGGLLLHICYLLFYYLWTQKRREAKFYKDMCTGLAVIIFLISYVQIEDPEKVEFRFGVIVTVLLIGLIASPLFSLGEIIRTKNTDSLPFPMIISGFVVSAHWLLYGIIIKNSFVIFQNLTAVLLCLIQLSLYIIFPKSSKKLQ